MNIMVLGAGGREHAIVWKLSQSPLVNKIVAVPGNAGIDLMAKRAARPSIEPHPDISITDHLKLLGLAREKQIDLLVVGPELPLVNGIVDLFTTNGVKCFGPDSKGARLEGSKIFTKELLREVGIPTANFEVFNNYEEAARHITERGAPVVVKADGLAAGKGVFVCKTEREALEALHKCLIEKTFGKAGERVLIEDMLIGRELSFLALIDECTVMPLEPAQDYKRACDNDEGENTGGMGCFSPSEMDSALKKKIITEIIKPVLEALKAEGSIYRGVLYAGLMLTEDGPKVLEYNVRFGDPETQVLLPRIKSDFAKLLWGCATDGLAQEKIQWNEDSCVCVVAASDGYPGEYESGLRITGINEAEKRGAIVFHAGTKSAGEKILTAGGRVLNICALGKDLETARQKVYTSIVDIQFKGMHYRKDIANFLEANW